MDQKTEKPPVKVQKIPYNSLQVGTLLGHGGYGDVYKALWHGTEVALKQLHLKTLSPTLQEEFLHEAQIMAQCQFPHIINLYGVCDEAGHNGLVMEYMPRGSLRGVLEDKSKKISWDIRWNIGIDIGKGLTYLHSNNILHRDLKSLNVLLGADYHAKICDFGLSKIKLESSSSASTQGKSGTVRWRAPETFKRGFKPASSTDVYSYGMVLWEIASREIPFAEASDEVTAGIWIKDGEKENIPADCPKSYGEIVQACWQEAEKRPGASEIVTSLTESKPAPAPIILSSPTLAMPQKQQKPYVEKSWHFDPVAERKALVDDPSPYQILEATDKDKQKVVGFYQTCPVAGYEIGRVQVIYNRDFNQGFELQMKKLQHRDKSPAFTPKWQNENNPQWRAETHKKLEDMARPHIDNDYPAVKLLPVWHGTKPEILPSIFSVGYVNLATTDSGFFGKGVYGAHEAEYPHRVYSKGALILNWVAIFSAYPVIDGDMNKLTAKGSYQNYDAHFVPVVPQNPNNPGEMNYFPCPPNQKNQYTEIVVFDSSSCLPRYLVELQSTLPKPLAVQPLIQKQVQPQPQIVNQSQLNQQPYPQHAQSQNLYTPHQHYMPPLQGYNQLYNQPIQPQIKFTSDQLQQTYSQYGYNQGHQQQVFTPQGYNPEYQQPASSVNPFMVNQPQQNWHNSGSAAIALYDYDTNQEGYLSFKAGENINILEKTGEWWKGELKGKIGFIPSNYIKLKDKKEEAKQPVPIALPVKPTVTITSKAQAATSLPQKISSNPHTLYQPIKQLAPKYECKNTLYGHTRTIRSLALLPNGNVISGSYDKTLKVWDIATGKCVRTLQGHSKSVMSVAVLPNGHVISGSNDNTLKVWNIATGQCVRTLEGHNKSVLSIVVMPNGKVVSGSRDKTLKVWDIARGQCVGTLQGHSRNVECVAVLPNGNVISGSFDQTLKVWDIATGTCVSTLRGHSYNVCCVAVLPNGNVISGSRDDTLKVWDIATGKCVSTLHSSVECVAVLPNGHVISGSNLKVWDIATGQCISTLQGYLCCVAVLPNGNVISGSNKELKVWIDQNALELDIKKDSEAKSTFPSSKK